jgi:hypothetical protein
MLEMYPIHQGYELSRQDDEYRARLPHVLLFLLLTPLSIVPFTGRWGRFATLCLAIATIILPSAVCRSHPGHAHHVIKTHGHMQHSNWVVSHPLIILSALKQGKLCHPMLCPSRRDIGILHRMNVIESPTLALSTVQALLCPSKQLYLWPPSAGDKRSMTSITYLLNFGTHA